MQFWPLDLINDFEVYNMFDCFDMEIDVVELQI